MRSAAASFLEVCSEIEKKVFCPAFCLVECPLHHSPVLSLRKILHVRLFNVHLTGPLFSGFSRKCVLALVGTTTHLLPPRCGLSFLNIQPNAESTLCSNSLHSAYSTLSWSVIYKPAALLPGSCETPPTASGSLLS
jgi:hypothetical protein